MGKVVAGQDLILNTDISDTIQGHVGPNTKQVFRTLTAVPFAQPKLKLDGYEFLMVDQFGNHYHKMRAVLFDGEMYDVDQFIKPSMMMDAGGGHADFEDFAAKQRLKITEALLSKLRQNGALTFARTNLELLKVRQMTQSPVAIETKDITHQANKLEDALTRGIEAAKAAAGEPVQAGVTPPEFEAVAKPEPILKATKAEVGEPPDNVVQFPDLTVPPPRPKRGA